MVSRLKLERNYISMLERGERQPTLTTLVKLARPLRSKASHMVALVESAASTPNDQDTPTDG